MTFGDVLAIVGLIGGTAVTLWMAIVAVALFFSNRVARASEILASAPGKTVGIGFAAFAGIAIPVVAMLNFPGPFQLLGGLIGLLAVLVSLIGCAGMATLAADRMAQLAPDRSRYAALGRAAALLVGAGLLPVVGTFLLLPLQLAAGLGAGLGSLRRVNLPEQARRRLETASAAPVVATMNVAPDIAPNQQTIGRGQ